MKRRHLLLVLGATLAGGGCNRWRPSTPRMLRFRDPVKAFGAARTLLKQLGYRFVVDQPRAYHFEVLAKLDQPGRRRSFIGFRVYSDGLMIVYAHGAHVKAESKQMHRKLAAEIDNLLQGLPPR